MNLASTWLFAWNTAIAQPVYDFDPVVDSGVLTATAAISLAERRFLPRASTVSPMCSLTSDGLCDIADLHPIDAAVVGRWNEDWALATDVALVGSMTLPYAILAIDSLRNERGHGLRSFAVDSAIVMESYLLSNVAVVTLKYAMRRPRPTQYTNEAPAELFGQLEHQLSFPSGHTAAVASAMSATTITYWLRNPESPGRWALLVGSVGLTGLTAVGRVQAGKHFPSDVLTGALLGGAIGLIVPWLHRAESRVQPSVRWTPGGGVMLLSGELGPVRTSAGRRFTLSAHPIANFGGNESEH